MLASMAWRNLSRNLRRSILTGAAVSFGVLLIAWMLGMNEGAYAQMIDQAVRAKLGHMQLLPRGYLDHPQSHLIVANAEKLASRIKAIDHVKGLSPRTLSEGLLARDSETVPVDLLGITPLAEKRISTVPDKLLTGEKAVVFCREQMADALEVLGNDEKLFARWCEAASASRYLSEQDQRALVLGSSVAKRLLVSIGDEVTVQVVRTQQNTEGKQENSLSQRRLEVVGLVHTGNPEVDERAAYLPLKTLSAILGTAGPTEIVVLLDDIRYLEQVKNETQSIVAADASIGVHSWDERNPALSSLIEMDSGNNNVMYIVLCLLVTLGVINATMMSVLERTKEFGVVLALGAHPRRLFSLVMTEVAILGALSVGVGALLGAGLEFFGRFHGWPLEWFGYDENMQNIAISGITYEAIYYSALTPQSALVIICGVYFMFLLAGIFPAIRASRLQPVQAMRER